MDQLRSAAEEAGQGHIFDGWASLSAAARVELQADLEDVDFGYVDRIFRASTATGKGEMPSHSSRHAAHPMHARQHSHG